MDKAQPFLMRMPLAIIVMLLALPVFSQAMLGHFWQFPDEDGFTVVHVNILNHGSKDADDLSLATFIPELGIYEQNRSFDLPDHSVTGRTMYLDIDGKEDYFVQIFLIDERGRLLDSRHLELQENGND